MKAKLLLILLCLSSIFMGCSDKEDTPSFSVANTRWAAEIKDWQASVPEEYRKGGHWVLSFSDKEVLFSIEYNGYVVRHRFKEKYRLEGEDKIISLSSDGQVSHIFYLKENGTVIYFPDCYNLDFLKQ